jgi:hypothetical protein
MNDHTVTSPLTDFLIAHGGLDSWRNAKGLSSTIISGGQLWGIKGIDMPPIPRRVTTEFHRQWMQVQPFGNPDWTMTWTPDHARITDEEGTIIAERENGREAFDRSYDGAWDPLNLAYFNGYAMWTYHAVPFVLANPGYRAREIASITSGARCYVALQSDSRRKSIRILPNSISTSVTTDCWRGTTMKSTYGRIHGPHISSPTISTWKASNTPTHRSVFARNPDDTPNRGLNLVTVDLSDYALI